MNWLPKVRPGMAAKNHKLTDEEVRAIRDIYAKLPMRGKQRIGVAMLAELHGVSNATIIRIGNGQGWGHVR